jgi:hypothetical protein
MNHRRIATWLGLLAAVVSFDLALAQPKKACQGGAGCAGSACPTSIASSQSTLPLSACPFGGENQNAVDIFSWNEFIALNWPATTSCAADPTNSILNIKKGNQGPVVWQTYASSDNVFVPPNQAPADWCTGDALSALFGQKPRAFGHIAKAPPDKLTALTIPISQPNGVQAVGGVVTDQSGRWLRYERLMNQPEYQAIVTNNWYRLTVINSIPSLMLPPGSLELKAAWKILTPPEIARGRYYTTMATVFNTPDHAQSPGPNPVTLGLVGLHIIQKTPQQGNFFWSTFEQVDNDKVFFKSGSKTPIDTQTASKPFTELNPNGTPINAPVQIKRLTPIPANPALNAYYRKLLAGSVFANYRLVSTQWTTGSGSAQAGTPLYVGNVAIETYVQKASNKKTPPSTGCLACHINATAANNTTITDHSFLFLEAQ